MKNSVYKLGRLVLLAFADDSRAYDVWSRVENPPKEIKSPASFFRHHTSGYFLVADASCDIDIDALALKRLTAIIRETGAGMVYSDYADREGSRLKPHPLIDYQAGSIRDDFNFGPLYILSGRAIETAIAKYGTLPHDAAEALYDLRLKISIDHALLHIPEFLYTAAVKKPKPAPKSAIKTEAQFAYVARENFSRQQKMEKAATNHLKQIGAYLPRRIQITDRVSKETLWKASIVIPVLNRRKTIADALKSALSQQTDFPFNILVVDNHSTDGTGDIIKKFAAKHPHIQHIIPSRRDLRIGGCWNEAIFSPFCGRYAVQLDSDDLYSSTQTLQIIVNALRRGRLAMVAGSYTLVNANLKPIPPGLIDHREWTAQNGHNNLLRVNGMGAPRAFDTAVLRQIGFPNVSYGEDYAVLLKLAREYKIGRIYESLYLCRRWSDNTDAGLSIEKQNSNDYYKDKLRTLEIKARQGFRESGRPHVTRPVRLVKRKTEASPAGSPHQIFAEFPSKNKVTLPKLCLTFFESQKKSWPALASAADYLALAKIRKLTGEDYTVSLQLNPARAASGAASVDPESIRRRPCFLCTANRPVQQHAILYRDTYLILCNPAPIFDRHFTIVSLDHSPQEIVPSIDALLQIACDELQAYTFFYNGPACGASAPDHLHFQMIPSDALPFLDQLPRLLPLCARGAVAIRAGKNFDRTVVVLESESPEALREEFIRLIKTIQGILSIGHEPPVNVFCNSSKQGLRLTVFLRGKHRPDAYFEKGENRIFVSPGAIDMAGVIVTPGLKDFNKLDGCAIRRIYREVSMDEESFDKVIRQFTGV